MLFVVPEVNAQTTQTLRMLRVDSLRAYTNTNFENDNARIHWFHQLTFVDSMQHRRLFEFLRKDGLLKAWVDREITAGKHRLRYRVADDGTRDGQIFITMSATSKGRDSTYAELFAANDGSVGAGGRRTTGSGYSFFFQSKYDSTKWYSGGAITMTLHPTGLYVGGDEKATAWLQLAAGQSAAGGAPLKFTQGALLATPELGAVEFDGMAYYGTILTNERQEFMMKWLLDSLAIHNNRPVVFSTMGGALQVSVTSNAPLFDPVEVKITHLGLAEGYGHVPSPQGHSGKVLKATSNSTIGWELNVPSPHAITHEEGGNDMIRLDKLTGVITYEQHGDMTGQPVVTAMHLWEQITNKPSEYPPAIHGDTKHDGTVFKKWTLDGKDISVNDGLDVTVSAMQGITVSTSRSGTGNPLELSIGHLGLAEGYGHVPSPQGNVGKFLKATGNNAVDWAFVSAVTSVSSPMEGSAIIVSPTTGDVVLNHRDDAGYKHIPSGGSSNQILAYGGESGAASWTSMSDAIHGNRGGGSLHATATESAAGFMSASDKTKLNGIAAEADKYGGWLLDGVNIGSNGAVTFAATNGLSISVSGIDPRSVSYGITAGGIQGDRIANEAITGAKIANNTITANKMSNLLYNDTIVVQTDTGWKTLIFTNGVLTGVAE